MKFSAETLYDLLPGIYRVRDAERGYPLKALMAVLAEEAGVVEDDIERFYENIFIETCDEWIVPYIGDLLAVRGLHALPNISAVPQRARVANTLRYRRRKGTISMLEQLAHDTTGWEAKAVEFFELLSTTQHMNHIRAHNHRTPILRNGPGMELIDTAFDSSAHTADVRHIQHNRGWHNISNIGLFLWRMEAYPMFHALARTASTPSDGRYFYSPLGIDMPLFNQPKSEGSEITHLAEEQNVPGRLRRRVLYDELEARRQTLVDGGAPNPLYFGDQPVFTVFFQNDPADPVFEVPPEEVLICNLEEPASAIPEVWRRPPASKDYTPSEGGADQAQVIRVAVDPVLGRLAFPAGVTPHRVMVNYSYGFSGDVGGGPYQRRDSVNEALNREVTWQMGVSQRLDPVAGQIVGTLTEAIEAWNLQPAGTVGVIAVMDNFFYDESLTGSAEIQVPEGSLLLIVAADWPETPVVGGFPGQTERLVGTFTPNGLFPHLRGDVSVLGTAPDDSETPGELSINGLRIEGAVTVSDSATAHLGKLQLDHCTVVPNAGGLVVSGENEQLKLVLRRCICGSIELAESNPSLEIIASVVDGTGGFAVNAPGARVNLQASTFLGTVDCRSVDAGNSLFTETLIAERLQEGCVRFCYLPEGSKAPRRFRCQPDLALSEAPASEANLIRGRMTPSFASTDYGDPSYAQLSLSVPEELRAGAEDGSEMGVFSFLKQAQRETNLRSSLHEYLRLGMKAGLVFVD